jgi:pre-mRNA-splicing helicase BRR2
VVLGTVQTIKDAASWLAYTYLYVRTLRAPGLYGVGLTALESDPLLAERRLDLAHTAAALLDKHNLLRWVGWGGRGGEAEGRGRGGEE